MKAAVVVVMGRSGERAPCSFMLKVPEEVKRDGQTRLGSLALDVAAESIDSVRGARVISKGDKCNSGDGLTWRHSYCQPHALPRTAYTSQAGPSTR